MTVSLKSILLKFFSARMAGMMLMTISSVVLARVAGPEIFGKYGVITTYFAIALVPLSSGVSNLIIRVIAASSTFEHNAYTKICHRMRIAAFLISVAFTLVLLLSFWGQLVLTDLIQLGIAVWFTQLTAMHLSVLRGVGKPHLAIIADQVIKPITITLGVLLWVFVGRYQINLDFLISVFTLSSLIGYIYARKMICYLPLASGDQENKLFDMSIFSWKNPELVYLCVVAIAYSMNSSIEILLMDWQSQHVLIGQYKVFFQIATLSSLVYVSVNYLAVERFSKLIDNEKFKNSRDSQILAILSLIGASFIPLILSFTGTEILSVLFGQSYSFLGMALWILLFAQMLNGLFGMSNSLLISRGETKVAMWLMLLVLVAKIISAPFLINNYGLDGAAWTSFGGLVIYKLLVWGYCLVRFGLDTSVFALHLKHGIIARFDK